MAVKSIEVGAFKTIPKELLQNGGIWNQRKNRDHPDHNIVEIGQNTQNNTV